MKIVILFVIVIAASIAATLIARSFGIGSSTLVGVGVAGFIVVFAALKLYSKKHKAI